MPTYTYFCEKCNKEFEEMHSINEELEECPECKTKNPKRLISGGTGFVLKGGGWANEGYK